MKRIGLLLAMFMLLLVSCGKTRPVLARMECQVDGRTVATIRFSHEHGRLVKAEVFDASKRWLFTSLPHYAGGKMDFVVYSSSEQAQRAVYSSPNADSLIARFQGKADFQTNAMRLDRKGRVVQRLLTFQNQVMQYSITMAWNDNLPQRIDYTFSRSFRGVDSSQGGALVYHNEDGLVQRIEVIDSSFAQAGNVEIVCHYAPSGQGPHDWSEKELYLPSPLLLMSAWSVSLRQETP